MRVPLTVGVQRAALASVAVVLALGCGAARARRDGVVDARAVSRLERIGQRDMRCREAMRVVQLAPIEFQVDGCGQLREYAYSCAGRRRCDWEPVVPAVGRATVDMQCPIEHLVMAAPSAMQRDFLGCGRAASYQLACMDGGCTWVSLPGVVPAVTASPVAAPPPTIQVTVGDATLEGAVIPPPPGAQPTVAPSSTDPSTAVVPPPPQ